MQIRRLRWADSGKLKLQLGWRKKAFIRWALLEREGERQEEKEKLSAKGHDGEKAGKKVKGHREGSAKKTLGSRSKSKRNKMVL